MKLANGFCIPEPLPVHTCIKGRQMHPLIRFLLRSRVDEKSADLQQSHSSLFCSWLASRCSQRSPSQQRFPWALQLTEQILKEQITDERVFFKMPFRPYPSGCGRFLSADDGHDRCLQCLGFQHAEKMRSWMTHAPVVGVWAWLRCDLAFPFWKDWHPLLPPALVSLARAENHRLALWEIWG